MLDRLTASAATDNAPQRAQPEPERSPAQRSAGGGGARVTAARQKRRVRFATAAGLVNELVDAKHQLQLRRVLTRWSRHELLAIDEVGYVPMADVGAEFLFQVIAERAEKAAVILTTNLPFSEWTQVIPSARLCKALIDRITDRAHIIETGAESYRFRRTMEKQRRRETTRQV
jgi:DNA replication protein DnaC